MGLFAGGTDFLFPHWTIEILARDGIESQFDAAGDADLVIDRTQIVSNRVLAESELLADLPCA